MTSRQPLQPAIQGRIIELRARRVMLDADLAQLYGVETRVLIQSVKRNIARFPGDFMFRLTPEEFRLTSQIVISNIGRGGRRTPPYAFTEQGVAMLSSVLGSPHAIAVNIEIMRTFVRIRELAQTHADLAERLGDLERKTEALACEHEGLSQETRSQLRQVREALRALMAPPASGGRPIGFVPARERGR